MAGVNIDQMREIKRLVEETNAIYYGLTDRKTLTYYLGKAVATYSAFLPGYIEVFGMWAVEAMAANSVPWRRTRTCLGSCCQAALGKEGFRPLRSGLRT